MIDINLQQYFNEEFSEWDNINRCIIDPNRWSHREKFKAIVEKILDRIPIETIIEEIEQTISIREYLEQLDKDLIYILQIISKKIEGLRRAVPFSKEKVRKYIILQY